jgi:uncharacterized SAM-binding protein YcdF (DUF218 family)
MLDPKLCSSPNLLWTSLIADIVDIFTTPKIALISGVIFLGLTIISYFWLRNFHKIFGFVLLISLSPLILSWVVTSAFFVDFANAQLMRFPDLAITPSDAIVVLGRGAGMRDSRVNVAAELWRSQAAPRIFASGRGDANEIQDLLKKLGIPDKAVDGEACSRTTNENAEFTNLILEPQGVKKILLVTDPPHTLRSLLTFQRYGFKVLAAPSLLRPNISDREHKLLILREYFALIIYKILGRLA